MGRRLFDAESQAGRNADEKTLSHEKALSHEKTLSQKSLEKDPEDGKDPEARKKEKDRARKKAKKLRQQARKEAEKKAQVEMEAKKAELEENAKAKWDEIYSTSGSEQKLDALERRAARTQGNRKKLEELRNERNKYNYELYRNAVETLGAENFSARLDEIAAQADKKDLEQHAKIKFLQLVHEKFKNAEPEGRVHLEQAAKLIGARKFIQI